MKDAIGNVGPASVHVLVDGTRARTLAVVGAAQGDSGLPAKFAACGRQARRVLLTGEPRFYEHAGGVVSRGRPTSAPYGDPVVHGNRALSRVTRESLGWKYPRLEAAHVDAPDF